MASTNFLLFDYGRRNILTDIEYADNSTRINGAVAGIYPSALHNKLSWQTSAMVTALATMMVQKGYTVRDGSAGVEGDDFDALVEVLSHLMTDMDYSLEAHTTDYSLTARDILGVKTFCNTGASSTVTFTLPDGTDNAKADFLVTEDGKTLKVLADSSDRFQFLSTRGALGGYIQSSEVGTGWSLKWTGSVWMVCSVVGNVTLSE